MTTAKPLLPIAGKPIVQRLVEDILATANEKVEEIAFVIAPHFGEETEAMLLSIAQHMGAKGKICYQEEALGTAHAILCAGDSLQGNVFIAFADTLFKADFKIDTAKDAIVWTQKVEDPSAFGVVLMDAKGKIEAFIEKPLEFVSDLAIIGVYYFKDGEGLRKELQYLLDNDLKEKGEYQLTSAMENMKKNGLGFYCDQVEEWLDCGNKDATVYTNQRILAIKQEKEPMVDPGAQLDNAVIIPPCYIGKDVVVRDSVIGPYVSIESGCRVERSVVENSILQENTIVKNANITNSMLGKSVNYRDKPGELNLGDFSAIL